MLNPWIQFQPLQPAPPRPPEFVTGLPDMPAITVPTYSLEGPLDGVLTLEPLASLRVALDPDGLAGTVLSGATLDDSQPVQYGVITVEV